ncbi:MAG: hypothetical protein ACREDQ_05550 [Limisphaerales bacterium]
MLYQLSYMGTLKSSFNQNTPNDKKPLPLTSFLSKIEGQPALYLFYGSDALQISNPTRRVNTLFS